MNIFDRFIDAFSARDLGKRVKLVIVFGLVLCLITGIGAYYFLTKDITISVGAVVSGTKGTGDDLAVMLSLDHDDIGRLPEDGNIVIEQESVVPSLRLMNARIISIDPATGVIMVALSGNETSASLAGGTEIEIIISRAPLWEMLLKK